MALISRNLLHRRPQELGKVKLGGKGEARKKRGSDQTYQLPVKYDHFVVTTRMRGPDGNFLRDADIHSKIGEHPMELAGVLMFDRPDENLHTEMVEWKGRGKDGQVVSCDGEVRTTLANGQRTQCIAAGGGTCACKPYSRFHLQLLASEYTLGYHVLRSQGWETCNNLQSALEEIYERFGTCFQAPVKLILYPSEDVHDSGVSTSYKVGLVLAMPLSEAAKLMVGAREQLAAVRDDVRLLAAGVKSDLQETDVAEAADVAKTLEDPPLPPSGPQAVSTAKGEPTAAPVKDAQPLPVENAFDSAKALRRLMATLKDSGITDDAARKQWAADNGLPKSTKQWSKEHYDRAQEVLEAPTIEAVHQKLEGDVEALAELSRRVLGKDVPAYLKDWKALLAALEATADDDEDEDGEEDRRL